MHTNPQVGTSVVGLNGKAAQANRDIVTIMETTHRATEEIATVIDLCDDNKTVETMKEVWDFLDRLENATTNLNRTMYGMSGRTGCRVLTWQQAATSCLTPNCWDMRASCLSPWQLCDRCRERAHQAWERSSHHVRCCGRLPVPRCRHRHGNRPGAGRNQCDRQQGDTGV